MNHPLLLRVTAPAVAVGILLFAACAAGARYISVLQANLADIVSKNVASLQAAQELEIRVRQLRFHSLLYLMDHNGARLTQIEDDQQQFEEAFEVARRDSSTPEEQGCIRKIQAGYEEYQRDQARLRAAPPPRLSLADAARLMDAHPLRDLVVVPSQELLRLNKEKMEQIVAESARVRRQGNLAMLVLGLTGPIGGIVVGYGVARGLSRSLYRLSVRVQDMAQHLDRDVASVSVAADGDIPTLDRNMQYIVGRVEEVAARLQQQQREMLRADQLAAVGQLAAGVAHEVRNPLTGIKMLVEAALRSRNPTPLNSEDLRVMLQELTRLEQTVQGFLNFARVPSPQRSMFDLCTVVSQARDLVRARARQQGIEIAVHGCEQPVAAWADSGQLTTVLVNLFLNALDAMPHGGRLEVVVDATDADIHIEVTDTGAGVPPEIMQRLFTPFATTKATGTGLGLSICRRILEEHGGSITAVNQPDGGACFRITLPAKKDDRTTDHTEACHADAADHRR